MAVEETLVIVNLILGVAGVGGISSIGIILWKGGQAAESRKRDLVETNTKIDSAISGINTKLDAIKEDVSGKIDSIKIDLADVKHDIRNGGLKEAVTGMQASCGARMAIVETRLEEHTKLDSHPGVTDRISAAEARITNIEREDRKR